MKTIILDIETTGDNHLIDEVCQMSYLILDDNFKVIDNKNFFFKVDYVHFKSRKRKLDINELKKLSSGKTFKDNYNEIFSDLNNSLIVCHNAKHDLEFIKSEFMRSDKCNQFTYQVFCTMDYYTDILKIPSDNFGYKYPKLIEIMPYLNIKRGDIYNKSQELFDMDECDLDFHDSRVDVVAAYLIAINTNILLDKAKALCNKRVMPNGDVYEGKIVDRVGIGTGKWTFSGNVYEGDFFDWVPNGKGQFFFEDGSHYVGRVVKGKLKGSGRYTFKSGTVYEGEFLDDKFNGVGKLIWPDGTIFEGSFLNDKKHGYGKLTRSGDILEEGIWDKGILQDDYKEEAKLHIDENTIQCMIEPSKNEINDVNILNKELDNKSTENDIKVVDEKRSFLRSIFSFKGTISGGQYISYKVLLGVLSISLVYIWGSIYSYTEMSLETLDLLNVTTIIIIYFVNITLIVRRLHDINRSAWWLIAILIPIVNIIIGFELIFKKGIKPNKYSQSKSTSKCVYKNGVKNNVNSETNLNYKSEKEQRNINKNSNKYKWITISSIAIIGIFLYYNIIEVNNKNDAIDLVKNSDGIKLIDIINGRGYIGFIPNNVDINNMSMEECINYKIDDIKPDEIYGWEADKVEKDIYMVSFDFDINSKEDSNYNCYPFEVNIKTGVVSTIKGDNLIKKYYDLGYFDEESYWINEFDN